MRVDGVIAVWPNLLGPESGSNDQDDLAGPLEHPLGALAGGVGLHAQLGLVLHALEHAGLHLTHITRQWTQPTVVATAVAS
eukprot:scaffold183895_cov39-Prasinocladus_malaysianus.AAC.2